MSLADRDAGGGPQPCALSARLPSAVVAQHDEEQAQRTGSGGSTGMPIYQTAHYQVRPEAVDTVTAAIVEFVD